VDDLQRLGHALFAHGTQAIEEGAAYVSALGARGNRLEHVLAGAYAVVHVHFDLLAGGGSMRPPWLHWATSGFFEDGSGMQRQIV